MKQSLKVGICFGITSGIITTLGLMVGLNSGTKSKLAVIGGILTIAIADSFSDALGIHISEESDKKKNKKQIWESTVSTFAAKFLFALTFMVPILLFTLKNAIYINIAWGAIVLSLLSYMIAQEQNENRLKAIFEHLFIAGIVIISSHYLGKWISVTFGE